MDIQIENLSKSYGEKTVLNRLFAVLPEHRCSGIMGASGCGKTTLLRILMGLEQADEGEIRGMPAGLAAVFQEDRLCEGFSAVANVAAVLNRKVPRAEIEAQLRTVGLGDSLNEPVYRLSGGMKRRVAIVRACMAKSDLVLLDEPFRGLDSETKRQTAEYVVDRTRDKTIVMTTHDEVELNWMHCSQILRLE